MSVRTGVLAMALIATTAAPVAAQTARAGGTDGSLSSKLSKSGGVIKPKSGIDPDMHVPAPVPHPNTTPVIPPSATGGNTAK